MKINRKIASRYLFIILFTTIFLNTTTIIINEANAAAANQLRADKLTIQLFPEFTAYPDSLINKPAILISYRGIMTNNMNKEYSGNIEVPVPTDATNFKLGLVTEINQNQEQKNLNYVVDNDKGLIYITPSRPININEQFEYDLQYYITPFDDTSRRNYSFIFTANSDVELLEVFVYPPLGSRYFELNPVGVNFLSDKLESYYYSYNKLKKDDKIEISFTYIKEDNIPTFDRLMLHSDNNNDLISRNNSANAVLMLTLILIFGLLLIALIVKQKSQLILASWKTPLIKKDVGSLKQLRGLYINNKISEAEYYKQRTQLLKKGRNDLE